MRRTARASVADTWYHVLNRGNRHEVVFHKPADYDAFVNYPFVMSGGWTE